MGRPGATIDRQRAQSTKVWLDCGAGLRSLLQHCRLKAVWVSHTHAVHSKCVHQVLYGRSAMVCSPATAAASRSDLPGPEAAEQMLFSMVLRPIDPAELVAGGTEPLL